MIVHGPFLFFAVKILIYREPRRAAETFGSFVVGRHRDSIGRIQYESICHETGHLWYHLIFERELAGRFPVSSCTCQN